MPDVKMLALLTVRLLGDEWLSELAPFNVLSECVNDAERGRAKRVDEEFMRKKKEREEKGEMRCAGEKVKRDTGDNLG